MHSPTLRSALVVLCATLALPGCKRDEDRAAAPPPAAVRLPGEAPPPLHPSDEDEDEDDGERAAVAMHSADALGAQGHQDLGATVDAALVERFVAYRRLVVQKSRGAAERYARELRATQKPTESNAARAGRAAEEFAVRIRAIEEASRQETKLSREEVGAAAQVVGAVLSQRQVWKLSGGDEVIALAVAQLEALPAEERERGLRALEASREGFVQMREARDARRLYGDAAVDAVLLHEDALWTLQQESTGVMAQVY